MSVNFQLVFYDEFPHLLHLVGFGLAALGLKVENFFDADFEEKGVTAFSRAAGETGTLKDKAKIVEGNVRIGTACKNPGDDLFGATHWAGA
jgi:hypothetical protein